MNSWTISKQLIFLTTVNCLILIGVGAFTLNSEFKLAKALDNVGHIQLPAVQYMGLVDMMHDGLRGAVLKLLIVSERSPQDVDKYYEELQVLVKNIYDYTDRLKKLDIDSESKKALEDSADHIDEYVKICQLIADKVKAKQITEAYASLDKLQESFAYLEDDLGKLGEQIESNAEKSIEENKVVSEATTKWSIFLLAMGILLGLILSTIIIRKLVAIFDRIISTLVAESEKVGSSSRTIQAASQDLSSQTLQQSSALQETAASLEEINSMMQKTADNAIDLKKSVTASSRSVDIGQRSVQDMLTSMSDIANSNKHIMAEVEAGNNEIKEIVRVISEIGEKTKVINDIVFQTKLLSFNASVEAARAGEHGKGFSVVAEEVGNLATMSGNAAKEISTMLESGIQKAQAIVSENQSRVQKNMEVGQRKISEGSQVANRCGEALTSIVEEVTKVTQIGSEIQMAIEEQTKGVTEINKAVQLIEQSTLANTSTAQSASATSKNLVEQFNSLKHVIGQLSRLIYSQKENQSYQGMAQQGPGPSTEHHLNSESNHKHAA